MLLSVWQLGGLTFTAVLGTLLHFLYDWTKCIAFVPISAVNESTWEHMKIMFFPMIIFACIQNALQKGEYRGFWWIKLFGTLTAVLLIPILFYTIGGAFGKTPDWLNVLIFFLSAGVGYFVEIQLFKKDFSLPYPIIAIVIFVIIALFFAVFTFFPPKLPLFQDPLA